MRHLNISSIDPIAPTEPRQGVGVQEALEAEIPERAGRHLVGDFMSHSNFSSVDPLAYYAAYAWVEEISAHLDRPGGYYRVNGQQYSSLEGAIRAIVNSEPVIERGEVVKRKQYRYPRPKRKVAKGKGRWKWGVVTKSELDRMVEQARRLMAEERKSADGVTHD